MMIGARDYCISINYQYIIATSISSSCVHILLFYRCVKRGVIPRKKNILHQCYRPHPANFHDIPAFISDMGGIPHVPWPKDG